MVLPISRMAGVVLLLVLVCSRANGAIIVFSGKDSGAGSGNPRPNSNAAAASFDAAAGALGPVSLITFESAPLGAFSNLAVAAGVSINGNDVSSNDQTIRNTPVSSPDSLYGYNVTGGGSQFVSFLGGDVVFTFATPIQAFGTYYSGGQLTTATIQFFDGSSQTISIPNAGDNGGIAFIGFTDAGQSISSVRVNAVNDIVAVDDVRFVSAAAAVPEPSTLVIFALAGLGFASRVVRRRFSICH